MITGDEIKAARQRAGLTREQFAELTGVHAKTVANWERGATAPRDSEHRIRTVLSEYLDASAGPHLQQVTDVELLAEIARRFARGAGQRKDGGGDDRDAASMNDEDPTPPISDAVAEARRRGLPDLHSLPGAARDTGRSGGKHLTRTDDRAGEPEPNDRDDMEPR